jgi:HNH endonuclease
MNAAIHAAVWDRAERRCEYCRVHNDDWDSYSFHIEHIYAKKHGGSDDPQNLCLSCPQCNWAKGSDLSGLVDGKIVPLFHPRRQVWSRHFQWEGPILVGKTLCAKATIYVLDINNSMRVELRQILIDEGRFPPED